MSFDHDTKSALAHYRSKTLHIAEKGLWSRNQQEYDHILPKVRQQENILPSIRESFWKYLPASVKLHTDFHHLNSSQALCFNLFFSLKSSKQGFALLLDVLGIDDAPEENAQFEFIPDRLEFTNIDFMLPLRSGARVLFEIKYTEKRFDTVDPTAPKYLEKFDRIYKSRVGKSLQPEFQEIRRFCENYQVLRNVLHLREGLSDTIVFLIPLSNESLTPSHPVIRNCVSNVLKKRVQLVFFEELIPKLLDRAQTRRDSDDLIISLNEFREKYFPAI